MGRSRVRAALTAASPGLSAVFFRLARELHDQDGVLGRQTYQHHETDLRQHIDRHASRQQAGHRCQEAHRHDHHDRQRQFPALILRGKHQEDEQGCRAEHQQGRRSRLLLLVGQFGPFETDAGRQNLAGEFLHPVQRGACRNARRGDAHDLGGGKQIISGHPIRRIFVFEARHRADRHHLSGGVARLEPGDVLRIAPIAAVRLRDHLVRSAEIIEVVDVLRTEIDLQRREHVGRRQADLLGLLAIDIRIDRRRAGAEQREDAGETRILVGGARPASGRPLPARRSRARRGPAASS